MNEIPTWAIVIALPCALLAVFMIGAAINDWMDGW